MRCAISDRVPTGIPGFDELVDGGFPRNSMILLAGPPGSGKTTFSAQFIHGGAVRYGEPGVYVCLNEDKAAFTRNMFRFGLDFESLARSGLVRVLDLSLSVDLEVQSALNRTFEAVNSMEARRLVVDSITAMTAGLKSLLDRRYFTRLFYRLINKCGCTAIAIAEVPWAEERIGRGVKQFIADGIVLMKSYYDEEGNLRRILRIPKMRSTNCAEETYEFKIDERGIEVKAKR